jgi:glycosyltransferase involved in cell wall biosynthesis
MKGRMDGSVPTVSVLMTTYKNDPVAVRRAVESILNQTYRNLELIVVLEPNDPGTALLRSSIDDSRLIIAENAERLGRSKSYNFGLRLARGRYLARMDADDYAYSNRLEHQISFLDANPDIAVVGTNVRVLDMEGKEVGFRNFPPDHTGIVRALTFMNPMMHPTIVWDRDKVGRDVQFDLRFSRFCDDLELWMRFISQGHKFANLPNVYLDYQQLHDHRRPRENWQLNFAARAKHWRMGLRYPQLFLGMAVYGVLMLMPHSIIDFLTKRNKLSDRIRTLESSNGFQEHKIPE